MATAEPATRPHADRHSRRRPFSAWMKRLANLKNSATGSPTTSEKKNSLQSPSKPKKNSLSKSNNPYPESGHLHQLPAASSSTNGQLSFSTPNTRDDQSYTSYEEANGGGTPIRSSKSTAPTLATNPETVSSDAGQSKAGTSGTVGGGTSSRDDGVNSTFSSPNQSVRSLTTTLTTIQSTAPSALLTNPNGGPSQQPTNQIQSPVQFSHQYPISPAPASAIPSHLAPQPHPHTYTAATANNILTDDASIMTLASSSKRRRRHSLDTNASVRALAPSSLFGNSRESLPLSVLSGDAPGAGGLYTSQNRPSIGGLASTERASVYSSSGVTVPAIGSERNSYYAAKQMDGGSVRSGLLGHGRTDSISGSIGGLASPSSPLASPTQAALTGKLSRRSSEWKDEPHEASDCEDIEEPVKESVEHGKGNGTAKET